MVVGQRQTGRGGGYHPESVPGQRRGHVPKGHNKLSGERFREQARRTGGRATESFVHRSVQTSGDTEKIHYHHALVVIIQVDEIINLIGRECANFPGEAFPVEGEREWSGRAVF